MDFLKKNKLKIIVISTCILFAAYIVNGINDHTIIPDHIHSIDDKDPNDRTDEEKIIVLQRSLQKDPNDINVLIELADLYIHTGDNKSAKKTIEKILEIDPYNKEASVLQSELK